MALLADATLNAQSNLAGGVPSSQRTYTIPASPQIKVESVVATIDNGAGGTNTARLTLTDVDGEVIANVVQSDTIPAGDTGSATWALRLAAASGRAVTLQSAQYSGNDVSVGSGTTADLTWDSFDTGADLLDISVPATPTVRSAGTYAVSVSYRITATASTFKGSLALDDLGVGATVQSTSPDFTASGGTGDMALANTFHIPAGGSIKAQAFNSDAVARNVKLLVANVVRIA